MATLHDLARPDPSTRTRRLGMVAALAVALTLGSLPGSPAAAAPADDLTTRVADIQARVTEAEENLQRMTIEAEAASDAVLRTRAEHAAARAEAEAAAEQLTEAQAAVDQGRQDVAALGREAFMGGSNAYGHVGTLLESNNPTEMLQRAATLAHLGDQRAERLAEFEQVEAQQARADEAARSAVAERDRAAQEAATTEATVAAQLTEAQATFDHLAEEKAQLDEQLRAARLQQLARQGAADPGAALAQQEAAQLRTLTSAGGAALAAGRVTSCYGPRWGTMHNGVDVAAPIGTPIYAPEGGVVLDAGPASGFGLAVYLQHGDGSITVYGHVNQFFVTPGQVVSAGQQIAEVGNRGQSTGPHLHFEVHYGGLYANRSNPVPWLTARGISLGGC